jgi:F0F1-type ATP synthase assembly protein I
MVFELVYLMLAALWTGSMAYSLNVVQPKVAKFFTDEQEREAFLATLAHGNRWKVVAMASTMICAAVAVIAYTSATAVRVGFGVALALDLIASAVFVQVSWRHWPARVFAVPSELPAFRSALMIRAWTMLGLVGSGFVIALATGVGGR